MSSNQFTARITVEIVNSSGEIVCTNSDEETLEFLPYEELDVNNKEEMEVFVAEEAESAIQAAVFGFAECFQGLAKDNLPL